MLNLRRWSEEKFSASEPSKYPEGFEGVDRQIGLKSSGGKCSRQAAKAVSTRKNRRRNSRGSGRDSVCARGGEGGWRINEEARGTDVQLRSGSKSFSSTFPAGIVFSDHIYILLVKFARGFVRSVYITREILLTPLNFPHRRCCALSIDSAPRHFLETSVYVFHSRQDRK